MKRGAISGKWFPPPLAATSPPGGGDGERPLILGGSLTRSPEGRLQTLQTHGMYPSPMTVQQVWSSAHQRRYLQAWQGQPLEPVGYRIEWEPWKIACGHCARSLGGYVAYRTVHPDGGERGERGIVEDTCRRYEDIPRQSWAGVRALRQKPRFRLEGEIGRRAAKTTARFRCPGCGREYRRNLARLGQQLFDSPAGAAYLLE